MIRVAACKRLILNGEALVRVVVVGLGDRAAEDGAEGAGGRRRAVPGERERRGSALDPPNSGIAGQNRVDGS